MLAENEADRLRLDEIKKSRNQKQRLYLNNWTRLDFYREISADKQIDGFLMQYPHGRENCQAQSSYYYRGENQVFGTSKSSLNRMLSTIKKKKTSTG